MEDLDEITGYSAPSHDKFDVDAYETIKKFFQENNSKVFYGRQIEVIHEKKFFHWVSNRALHLLVADKVIKTEPRPLKWGSNIITYWHNSLRYYRRPAQITLELVERYSEDKIGSFTGAYGELLVIEGFAKLKFTNLGRNIKDYQGKRWDKTGHDLDLIIERDSIIYGVEIKNTLPYIEKKEYERKLEICHYLGIRPVFVVRMMPQNWISNIAQQGGFSLILEYLLYPELLKELVTEMKTKLFLPVDTPKSLQDGTMKRFEKWHMKNVK